jgi:copper chaperone
MMISPRKRSEERAARAEALASAGAPTSTTIATYDVTGMTCGHCELSVQEEVGELEGVLEVRAEHATGRVTVTSAAPLDPTALAAAVEEAGYSLA